MFKGELNETINLEDVATEKKPGIPESEFAGTLAWKDRVRLECLQDRTAGMTEAMRDLWYQLASMN
jgi:hypothetical protein